MKKLIASAVLASAAALVFSGCLFNPEPVRGNTLHTLGAPGESFPEQLRIQRLSNNSGVSSRMQFHADGNEVLQDEYRRWHQPPELLLGNYLRRSFAYGDDAPRLSLNIFLWESNLSTHEASLGVEAALEFSNGSVGHFRKLYSAPLETGTPEAVSEAFTACAEALAAELRELLQ